MREKRNFKEESDAFFEKLMGEGGVTGVDVSQIVTLTFLDEEAKHPEKDEHTENVFAKELEPNLFQVTAHVRRKGILTRSSIKIKTCCIPHFAFTMIEEIAKTSWEIVEEDHAN